MPDEVHVTPLLCGQEHIRREERDDEAIAKLASAQHGVVSRRQLLNLGVGRRSIEHRLAHGRLQRIHRAVYAVGHRAISHRGRVAAALLAGRDEIGRGAASQITAAGLWGLTAEGRGLIHITAESRRRRLRGVAVHRASVPQAERSLRDGLPVTSVARTLLDLSGSTEQRSLRRIVKQAEYLRLVDLPALTAILERHPRRPGRSTLATIVDEALLAMGRTRSDLEDRFLALCRRHGLPLPESNVLLEVGGEIIELDCVWRRPRVAVELDGYRAHGTRLAFEDDRRRDRSLAAAGWLSLRITHAQLELEPKRLVAELRATLAGRGADAMQLDHRGGA